MARRLWLSLALLKWNRRMEAVARLVGPKRFEAYGRLDLDHFFSNRVDPKSLVYNGIYGSWSLPALRLK